MKMLAVSAMFAGLFAATGCSRTASAGPNGGDVVPIKNGTAYAEVVSNTDTGEVLVQTYDQELKTRQPIESQPITVGSGENSAELSPYPVPTDPPGTCSRFYGQADWARGGGARRGWMRGPGGDDRQEFAWERGWEAGRMHAGMWGDMGEHRRLRPGHAPGGRGPIDR